MVEISQIISTINPDLYLKVSDDAEEAKKEIKEIKSLANSVGILKAAEKAKPKAISEHKLIYDSTSETLEPVYFFILDLMNDLGLAPEKLVDSFTSSPGSGHFAELGQRATIMQQQGSKILGDVNTVLRSVLNIIYDLKDFRMRLEHYSALKSEDKDRVESAILSLKQIWMDKVDIIKGNSSLKAMGLGQAGFTTLLDAFLAVKTEKDVDKIDLNDRVKRILKPRIFEFNIWVKESESELRKRYEMEKTYLRSQVNSLKLYSRWAKPYLKAASQLEMKSQDRNAALVKTFNTLLLELTLLGKKKIDVKQLAIAGDLPRDFQKLKTNRDYYSCILAQFNFRGIPQRAGGQSHYVFGGRTEVTFKAYALNQDELDALNQELEKSDVSEVLKLIENSAGESLEQLQEEINFFLDEDSQEKEKAEKKKSDSGANPFLALIGKYNNSSEESKPKKSESKKSGKKDVVVIPDSWIEKEHLRKFAGEDASTIMFGLFDVYKKAHGMASYT
ncbi:MAG: hypothetical protein KJ949_02390 [Nanoarchaeota archaeon]|nr:hypothetical protein [Nanoarchaeota archaeon]